VCQGKWLEGVIEASSWEMMGLAFGILMSDKQYDLSAVRETGLGKGAPTIKGYTILHSTE